MKMGKNVSIFLIRSTRTRWHTNMVGCCPFNQTDATFRKLIKTRMRRSGMREMTLRVADCLPEWWCRQCRLLPMADCGPDWQSQTSECHTERQCCVFRVETACRNISYGCAPTQPTLVARFPRWPVDAESHSPGPWTRSYFAGRSRRDTFGCDKCLCVSIGKAWEQFINPIRDEVVSFFEARLFRMRRGKKGARCNTLEILIKNKLVQRRLKKSKD